MLRTYYHIHTFPKTYTIDIWYLLDSDIKTANKIDNNTNIQVPKFFNKYNILIPFAIAVGYFSTTFIFITAKFSRVSSFCHRTMFIISILELHFRVVSRKCLDVMNSIVITINAARFWWGVVSLFEIAITFTHYSLLMSSIKYRWHFRRNIYLVNDKKLLSFAVFYCWPCFVINKAKQRHYV